MRSSRPLEEHEVVRLTKDHQTKQGLIPAGTLGTIVLVYKAGEAYAVEFEGEFEAPETILVEMLVRAEG